MALISFLPSTPNPSRSPHHHKTNKNTTTNNNNNISKKKKMKKAPPPPPPPPPKAPSSWEQFKSLLSCKNTTTAPSQMVHAPSHIKNPNRPKYTRLSSTCGSSICALRVVVHGNTRVTDHSSSSDSGSHVNDSTPLSARPARSATATGGGGMQLRKLSGCYECHAVDVHSVSRRYPRPRTLCPCADCGEVFTKTESLEMHQAIRHAVSELGPEDSGRNVVEIIFKSSWQQKDNPICTVERILKVHNTQRTITKFEDYRGSVKARASAHLLPSHPRSKNPRCAADGNELLRFHCTSISCSLGSNSSTSLCLSSANSSPCSVCTIIRYGFSRAHQNSATISPQGVRTTASSGRAHDWGPRGDGGPGGERRAMLVCRVIAGRVKRSGDEMESLGGQQQQQQLYDSVAGDGSLEELFVANPRAILPCFVVIYKALD